MSGLSPAIINSGGIIMAEYLPIKSSVVFRLNGGVDDNGKMVVRSVSMSRISPSVDADSLMSATDALGGLLALPVFGVEKVSTDSLED
jgi:hypothetical protein